VKVDDLLLGRDEQDLHLTWTGLFIDYLEINADLVHPEGDVLLGLPVDGLPRLGFGHLFHGDATDDHASSGNSGVHRLGLDARLGDCVSDR
jgi:hypothetical protein